MKLDSKQIAIVLLAYADYEALEISLASYARNLNKNYKLFILQNGKDKYDCERTLNVARRYATLFPNNVTVVDWIQPQEPYYAIKELLNSEALKDFDYICKVDDDVFPLQQDWLEKLKTCYEKSFEKHGKNLAYVTSLVNNNGWGFTQLLKESELKKEYFEKFCKLDKKYYEPFKEHILERYSEEIEKELPKNSEMIYFGRYFWENPYIAQWLHSKTTFKPDYFIKITKNLSYKEIDNTKNYSINCMLFKKEFWTEVGNAILEKKYDEGMIYEYCKINNRKIISDLSNPFVHLNFYPQREENRHLFPEIKKIYEKYWNLPFSISICPIKDYEIENRLRTLEAKFSSENKEERFLNIIAQATFDYEKIVFWGTSVFLRKLLFKYQINSSKILGIIDKNPERKGEKIGNFEVFSPDDITKLNPDLIIVSIDKEPSRVKDSIETFTNNKIKVITL